MAREIPSASVVVEQGRLYEMSILYPWDYLKKGLRKGECLVAVYRSNGSKIVAVLLESEEDVFHVSNHDDCILYAVDEQAVQQAA